jgi:AcrR family transcriptional regulator
MARRNKAFVRRTPTQARGQERVEAILEAAALEVDAVGYDAATTNAIARRAGASIGSLYQFFPNKAALMHALAVRYTEELKGLLTKVLEGMNAEGLTWQQIIEQIVDAFADFHATRAGFKAIWFGGSISSELLVLALSCGRDIAKSAEPLLEMVVPDMPPRRRALVTRVATEIVGALLMVSSHEKRPELVTEAKRAVIAYLERVVAEE